MVGPGMKCACGGGGGGWSGNKLLSRLIIIPCVYIYKYILYIDGRDGTGEGHMENWKRREKTLTAIPFHPLPLLYIYWRATLIKWVEREEDGMLGSTGQAYIKTTAKGHGESVNYKPFIITNPIPARHFNTSRRGFWRLTWLGLKSELLF